MYLVFFKYFGSKYKCKYMYKYMKNMYLSTKYKYMYLDPTLLGGYVQGKV